MKRFVSTVLLLATIPLSAQAGKSATPSGSPAWDHWYTVTLLPRTRYAYYRETLSPNKGRLHFKTEMWKKEEGFINSEQLGAFSEDTAEMRPLFYNFHANYRETEVSIDGSVEKSRLQIRIRRNNQEVPLMTRGTPTKAIFSSMFPIWLQRQLSGLPADQARNANLSFLAILEDNQDAGFPVESGRIRVVADDDYSKSSGSIKVQVEFNSQRSFWYLDKSGAPVRIEIPGQNTRVERVTEKQAKTFLDSP